MIFRQLACDEFFHLGRKYAVEGGGNEVGHQGEAVEGDDQIGKGEQGPEQPFQITHPTIRGQGPVDELLEIDTAYPGREAEDQDIDEQGDEHITPQAGAQQQAQPAKRHEKGGDEGGHLAMLRLNQLRIMRFSISRDSLLPVRMEVLRLRLCSFSSPSFSTLPLPSSRR